MPLTSLMLWAAITGDTRFRVKSPACRAYSTNLMLLESAVVEESGEPYQFVIDASCKIDTRPRFRQMLNDITGAGRRDQVRTRCTVLFQL